MLLPVLRSCRLPLGLAGVLLASSALVVAEAAAAGAPPITGQVHSSNDVTGAGCAIADGSSSDTVAFSSRSDDETADAVGTYTGTEDGSSTVGASGSSAVTTRAFATARDRAFRKVRLASLHVVALENDSAVDCGMQIFGYSSGDADLKVRKRGRIRIAWSATGGDIEQVRLTSASGATRVDRDPAELRGQVTVRVRRGTYSFFAGFRSSVRESDVAVGSSLSTTRSYSVEVTYLG